MYLDEVGLKYFWSKIKSKVALKTDLENYFEIDENGGLMPAVSPTQSTLWELDSNGDLQEVSA